MKVKIELTNDKAVIPFKTYPSDFCYDVVATSEEEIAPNVWKYGLGLKIEIEGEMSEPICIDFRPRSSIWKTGMVLSNSVGTIDSNYRGEISAVFYHVMPNMPRYRVGDKIGQIKLGFTLKMDFEEGEVNNTDRGTNGYGSTGK